MGLLHHRVHWCTSIGGKILTVLVQLNVGHSGLWILYSPRMGAHYTTVGNNVEGVELGGGLAGSDSGGARPEEIINRVEVHWVCNVVTRAVHGPGPSMSTFSALAEKYYGRESSYLRCQDQQCSGYCGRDCCVWNELVF